MLKALTVNQDSRCAAAAGLRCSGPAARSQPAWSVAFSSHVGPETISRFIQDELQSRGMGSVTAIEAAQWLDQAGILFDSSSRPGLPLRNLLRDGVIEGQRQEPNGRWFIHLSGGQVSTEWDLIEGDRILRRDLSTRYGGNPEAGIAPSARSPNLFVFSDPATGERYGYNDHWDGDVFHYYGMGRRGPQRMEGANKALLEHESAGRALRVFQGVGGEIAYLGEFELDGEQPYYWSEARDMESEDLRPVIVFKLRPLAEVSQVQETQEAAGRPSYRMAREDMKRAPAKASVIDPNATDRATNAHASLQNQLEEYVRLRGAETFSPGTLDPEFDLGWRVEGTFYLAEIKSLTPANESMQLRLGLGQLLHYRHVISQAGTRAKAILFVERAPTYAGWTTLCDEHGVQLLWPSVMIALTW